MGLRRSLRRLYTRLPVIEELRALNRDLDQLSQRLARLPLLMFQEQMARHPRYAEPKRLPRYALQTFSQNGEDGIIDEILRRIGAASCSFVEIGVGNGLESNTTALLAQGWRGWWIECEKRAVAEIKGTFREQLAKHQLTLIDSVVTRENVAWLLGEAKVPAEFDLLSIDIDRNTYWVWSALGNFRPRFVVVEYNSAFPPSVDWKVDYHSHLTWNGTSYFGASLKALEILGRNLGYSLVGCEWAGTSAFFVRDDLCADHFAGPFTAENHYEPPRYRALVVRMGHPPGFSDCM